MLCNPPYVNSGSMAALPPEFRAEPELALAGGDDGMDFVRALLRDLPSRLSPHGVLVLEIGHERPFFETAFPQLEVVWLSTSAGDDQVLLLTAQACRHSPALPTPVHDHPEKLGPSSRHEGPARWRLLHHQSRRKSRPRGRNGAGKSSLFRLLDGTLHEDKGDFSVPNHWRMAQVAQDMPETDMRARRSFVIEGDVTLA